ncbi:MAG: Nif3-like dinuclear metal center hexameric protein [Spirochaetes bacterium]|nr:Nif3-like dinuclear metal center hexameric protein [Spirochaetota bacterium]
MNKTDFYEELIKIFHPETQEDWDNSGKQLFFADDDLKGVVTALDFSANVLDQARSSSANFIVTHHPFFFEPVKSLDSSDSLHEAFLRAAAERISIVSFHTCADKLYLQDLAETACGKSCSVSDEEFYAVSDFDGFTLSELISRIKNNLMIEKISFCGNESMKLKKIAFLNGSGASEAEKILKKSGKNGINCVITGDVTYHKAHFADTNGFALIDASHFATEKMISSLMKRDICDCLTNNALSGVKVVSAVERSPLKLC